MAEEETFQCYICYESRIVSHTPACGHPICSKCLCEIVCSPTNRSRCGFCRGALSNFLDEYVTKAHVFPESISVEELDFDFAQLCKTGDLNKIQDAILKGADVEAVARTGEKPILVSAQKGHLDVVKFLQQSGADINAAIQTGVTPIFVSAQEGHLDVVKFLQRSGADVNAAVQDGTTSILISAQEGHLDVVKFLQQSGADLNAAAQSGATPIFISALQGHSEIVSFLRQHGADVAVALALAEQHGIDHVIQMLSNT